ncbi:NEMATODE-INDUCED LRR-RLK 1, Germination Repression and Cell Expansion receptor-like kinase [Hibiscus trionum]|uniref:NEMATODE-INDUCED LRR-RLK 1, Germination Repression and Cell Expansion receptor-like kinase n=1 Tax=Hibiscus trionum TaxID=183268 RepID=A0A9W7JD21_HIBTR|nr:NEMATODE-INDUCED LRR-RLK 1, Germination Repression and Cell Expansion receptor-like kinase [Hibiscus trionum]
MLLKDKAKSQCSTVLIPLFLILITAFAAVSGNSSLDIDKEVVMNLKSFLETHNRVNRGRFAEWNRRSSNPCDWHGVFCSNDGARITGIDLSDSMISGGMFNNFSALTELQHLDLSSNTLNGAVLDDLNRCHNLVYLNLSHNILEGELNLTGLNSLEKLDLSTNRFRGEVKFSLPAICRRLVVANLSMNDFWGQLDYFDGCSNLQYLDLSSNNFSGSIWTGFARLIEFSLSENYVTESVPASCFKENCSLQVLDLSGNKFHGEVPGEISNCKNMITLNLWGNNFTGPIPSELGSITTLESLLLGNNRFSRVIPESLLNLKNLALLDLRNNSFGGKVQEIFGKFTRLKSLALRGNSYTDGLLSSGIHELTNMSRLDLSYNDFSGALPVEIARMLGLKFLILAHNQFTGDIPFEYGDLSNLQALDLSFNGLSGSIPPSLGNLRSLLFLMLANNSLTSEIPHELGNCTSLLWLNLANNQLSGKFPLELTNIGRNPTPIFESNRRSKQMNVGPTECSAVKRLLTIDYPPFDFLYTILTMKTCSSIWDRLLKGYGFFQICSGGSSVREYVVSGYLQLRGNQLTGEVPSDIGKMQHVSVLDFGSNWFNGELPIEMEKLPLVVLNISRNRFSGRIPSEIGSITCLQNLDLSLNNFSGIFPKELSRLTDLNRFNISFNPLIDGTIPAAGQLATFGKESFLGNPLLQLPDFISGNQLPPLPLSPPPPPPGPPPGPPPTDSRDESELWKALVTGYGCGMAFGIAILYFSFRKREPKWFVTIVDGIHQWKAKRLLKRKLARRE